MIRHTVVFRLRHPEGSPAEADFLRTARAQLAGHLRGRALRGAAPDRHAEHLPPLALDGVRRRRGLRRLQRPSEPHAFVQGRWIPEVEEFLELDFEPYEARRLTGRARARHPRPDRRHAAGAARPDRGRARRAGPREVRAPEPGRQRQGPHRARDRARRRAARRAAPGRHDRRGDRRQHRRRPRARRRRARLRARVRDAREDVGRQARVARGARRARSRSRRTRRSGDPDELPGRRAPPGGRARAGSWPTSSATRRTRACTRRRPAPRSSRRPAAASARSSPAPAPAGRSPASGGSCAATARARASSWPTRSARASPTGSRRASPAPTRGYLVEGIGAGAPPPCLDRAVIDAAERITRRRELRDGRGA